MNLQMISYRVRSLVSRFIAEERAATAVEYAVIAAIVGIGLITVLTTFSENLQTAFGELSTAVSTGTAQGPGN